MQGSPNKTSQPPLRLLKIYQEGGEESPLCCVRRDGRYWGLAQFALADWPSTVAVMETFVSERFPEQVTCASPPESEIISQTFWEEIARELPEIMRREYSKDNCDCAAAINPFAA